MGAKSVGGEVPEYTLRQRAFPDLEKLEESRFHQLSTSESVAVVSFLYMVERGMGISVFFVRADMDRREAWVDRERACLVWGLKTDE